MKYKEKSLRVMGEALKSEFLFFGEALNMFAWQYPERMTYKCSKAIEKELTKDEEIRFFWSVVYLGDDGIWYIKDFEPSYIIELTRNMKIAFIKCIASDGYMPADDFDMFLSAVLNAADLLSAKEAAEKEKIPLFEWLDSE